MSVKICDNPNLKGLKIFISTFGSFASAVKQARARHSAAVDTRQLQEQLLEADRKKLASGMVEVVERKTRRSTDTAIDQAAAAVKEKLG